MLSHLSSLGVRVWWTESFLKQEVLHQCLDGAVSAAQASFLVSEAAPCVHFSFRIPSLTLPPQTQARLHLGTTLSRSGPLSLHQLGLHCLGKS